jgi:glutamate racemase
MLLCNPKASQFDCGVGGMSGRKFYKEARAGADYCLLADTLSLPSGSLQEREVAKVLLKVSERNDS